MRKLLLEAVEGVGPEICRKELRTLLHHHVSVPIYLFKSSKK
jgi:hypothetical protein